MRKITNIINNIIRQTIIRSRIKPIIQIILIPRPELHHKIFTNFLHLRAHFAILHNNLQTLISITKNLLSIRQKNSNNHQTPLSLNLNTVFTFLINLLLSIIFISLKQFFYLSSLPQFQYITNRSHHIPLKVSLL